jgi:hypothetical protein
VPLPPDLFQLSLILQLSLPQLDHSICPRTAVNRHCQMLQKTLWPPSPNP